MRVEKQLAEHHGCAAGHNLRVPLPLQLRPIETSDWRAVHSWGSLSEVCRYQPWGPNTVDQSRQFTSVATADWLADPQYRWVYLAQVGADVIGLGELRHRNKVHQQAEIQYIVHPRAQGQGHGTRIAKRLLEIGFQDHRMHRVYGTCDPRNAASRVVLRKAGMQLEGHLRHTMKLRDGWRDSEIYSVLSSEWIRQTPQGLLHEPPRVLRGTRNNSHQRST